MFICDVFLVYLLMIVSFVYFGPSYMNAIFLYISASCLSIFVGPSAYHQCARMRVFVRVRVRARGRKGNDQRWALCLYERAAKKRRTSPNKLNLLHVMRIATTTDGDEEGWSREKGEGTGRTDAVGKREGVRDEERGRDEVGNIDGQVK